MAVRMLSRRPVESRPSVLTDRVVLSAVRTLTYELPLGSAPHPFEKRLAWSWDDALAALEDALVGVAVKNDLVVDVRDLPEDVARRLVAAKAIPLVASDAIGALLPVLRCGTTGCVDSAVRADALKLTERVEGYLRALG